MLDPTTGFAAEWHRRLLDRRKQKEKERAQQKNKPGNREILNEDRRSNSDLGAGMDKIGDFAFGVLVYSCCWIIFRTSLKKYGGFFRAVSYWVSLGMESREGSAEDRVL